MSKLEKRLRALASGVELPWAKITALLESLGVNVQAPTGGGSHYKILSKERLHLPYLFTMVRLRRFMLKR